MLSNSTQEIRSLSILILKGRENMANEDIRKQASAKGMKLWQVADLVGYSPNWFSVKLRKELTPELKQEITDKLAKVGTK